MVYMNIIIKAYRKENSKSIMLQVNINHPFIKTLKGRVYKVAGVKILSNDNKIGLFAFKMLIKTYTNIYQTLKYYPELMEYFM